MWLGEGADVGASHLASTTVAAGHSKRYQAQDSISINKTQCWGSRLPPYVFMLASYSITVCASLCVRLSIYLSMYLSVSLSVCLSVSQSVYPSLSLCVCLSVRLPVCVSILPSVCLPVRLSVYHPSVNALQRQDSYSNPRLTPAPCSPGSPACGGGLARLWGGSLFC